MNSELMKNIYKRNMLKNKHKEHKSDDRLYEEYRIQRNLCTHMRRKAIKEYFMNKCTPNGSPKEFWEAVRPFLSDKGKQSKNIILKENEKTLYFRKEHGDRFS